MADINFIDFYIGYPGHPKFRDKDLIEDDVIRVIIQKYEMIIFTNKGDVLANPNLGADLYLLLHETRVSAETVEQDIRSQIDEYIPEISGINYELNVEFGEDPENYQEYMVIHFKLKDYEVYASVI
jgi:hypothetical protein